MPVQTIAPLFRNHHTPQILQDGAVDHPVTCDKRLVLGVGRWGVPIRLPFMSSYEGTQSPGFIPPQQELAQRALGFLPTFTALSAFHTRSQARSLPFTLQTVITTQLFPFALLTCLPALPHSPKPSLVRFGTHRPSSAKSPVFHLFYCTFHLPVCPNSKVLKHFGLRILLKITGDPKSFCLCGLSLSILSRFEIKCKS